MGERRGKEANLQLMIEALIANIKSTGIFVAVLSVLIVVHEWGHFMTAKKLGVKVERFSLGFGPKLFSWMMGGTEFLICLFPLGGYVKMAGDTREECKGTPDEFYAKSPGHRALIILNGPVVNFILAYVCLVGVFVLGFPDMSTKVGEVMKDYPAQIAGVELNDKIIKVDQKEVANWTEMQSGITRSTGKNIEITILRNNKELVLTISPKVEELKNVFGQVKETKIVGIRPTKDIITNKYSLPVAIVKGYEKLSEITVMTYKSLYFMLTGTMSAKESMTGPIGIFYIIKSAAEMGFNHLLFIVGVISASLAIFNLLPVIPLDGGHLFLLGIERLRGKALSPKIDEYIARFGFSLIILLAVFVFYSDFSRFGFIDKIKHLFF